MKFKTTKKEVMANYDSVIRIGYCGLQNLLSYEAPIAYTVRREGWAADIYDMGCGVATATGCDPFGKICPSYEVREKYEKEAKKILDSHDYEKKRDALKELQKKFVEEVLKDDQKRVL